MIDIEAIDKRFDKYFKESTDAEWKEWHLKKRQMAHKIFDLEHQYQLYLKRVGLKESIMHPVQKTETRRAFMGACGQMLVLLRDEVAALDDDEAIDVFQDMMDQVKVYFENEAQIN